MLACADSRVPVELVFDQSIGQIFVARVAGNIVTPEIIASLEYGAAVLGIRALLVLGHTNCGAVKAAMKAESVAGTDQLSLSAPPRRRRSVGRRRRQGDRGQRRDAGRAAAHLVDRDPGRDEGGDAQGGGRIYDLGTGRVALS